MNWKEKLKISIARTLLEFSDRLLGRNPDSFDTFLSAKAKEEQTLTQHILERRIEMGLGEKSSEKESSEGSWPLS